MRIVNKRVFYFGNVFGLTLGILFIMNIRIASHDAFLQPGMIIILAVHLFMYCFFDLFMYMDKQTCMSSA